jgi:tetratricopeptide (TPR) repeat protein
LKYLYDDPEWKLVYLNYDGVVFLKDIPQHQQIIAQHAIDLSAWKVERLDEYRLGSRKVVPYYHVNRAFSLKAMGFDNAALDEVHAALAIYPGYPEAFALLGQIAAERKEIPKAFHYFRLALTYSSEKRELRANFAKMYELMGRYDEAIHQYEIVVERFPEHPEAYFLLSRTYIKAGKFSMALPYARAGFQLKNNTAKDIMELGDILVEKKHPAEAIEMYAIALKGNLRLDELHLKIGDEFKKLGQADRAKEEWGMALDLATNDEQKEAVTNRLKTITNGQ